MHTDRLALLSARLRQPLPKRTTFDLSDWQEKTECGTTCCAVGLAMTMPEFKKMGLKRSTLAGVALPKFGSYDNWAAVNALFGIEHSTSLWLFALRQYPNRYRTLPTEVADRIDALIAGGTLTKAKAIMKGEVT